MPSSIEGSLETTLLDRIKQGNNLPLDGRNSRLYHKQTYLLCKIFAPLLEGQIIQNNRTDHKKPMLGWPSMRMVEGKSSTPIKKELTRPKGGTYTITFKKIAAHRIHQPHDDALVVTLRVGNINTHNILINIGNSVNVLSKSSFD